MLSRLGLRRLMSQKTLPRVAFFSSSTPPNKTSADYKERLDKAVELCRTLNNKKGDEMLWELIRECPWEKAAYTMLVASVASTRSGFMPIPNFREFAQRLEENFPEECKAADDEVKEMYGLK
jgi:hypothetical protein